MSTPDVMVGGRNHELDAARGILMVMGLVIHAANPYVSGRNWLVRDDGDLRWLGYFQELLHQFRMPGFFLISGLLGVFALRKYGAGKFVMRRATRLVWPFVATLLTINLIQYQYVAWYAAKYCVDAEDCPVQPIPALWVAHLWFLVFLFVYSWLLPLLVRVGDSKLVDAGLKSTLLAARPLWVAGLLAFLVLVANKAIASLYPGWYEKSLGIGSGFEFLQDLVFFALGALMAIWADLRRAFLDVKPATIFLILLSGVALYSISLLEGKWPDASRIVTLTAQLAGLAGEVVLTFAGVRVCMLLGRAIPGVGKVLAESSYSVYLFHHFLVVLAASALLAVAWHPFAKFTVTMMMAAILSYAIHRGFIARYGWASFLFNGTDRYRASLPSKHRTLNSGT